MSAPRAAVVGGGFGGLALAVRLQAAGIRTTLVEGRDQLGGRASVHRDKGYVFDGGPTVITAPQVLEDLWTVAGRRMADDLELLPVTPFYRLYWQDGEPLDYTGDRDAMVAQIRAREPRDVEGYLRFLRYSDEVFDEGFTKLAHVPFLDFWSMMRVAPQLVRLQAYRSVYSMVSSFIRHPHLRQAFSFHALLVGGNPLRTSSIYTLIHALERKWGVFFAKGGTNALVRALGELFCSIGGEIRLGSPVEEITTRGGKVTGLRTADGWCADFDAVASNADVVGTYRDLLAGEPLARPTASRLIKKRFSMSLFVVYFGVKRRHRHLAHHDVLFGPRYEGLLGDIFERGVLAEDFSLYLHAPTLTDPSVAPPESEAFYVLSPVPHLGKLPIDWSVEGPRYAQRILDHLERHFIPGLRADLQTMSILTPDDFASRYGSHLGSAFSLEPILEQSAYFRVNNRDARIGGLYFVGAGTHPGAGVPGVVSSARATAGLMIEDLIGAPARG